jgi:hypothetical protein
MRKLHMLAAGVAALAALMVGVGAAQATQSQHHRHHAPRPPATTLMKVTVRAHGPSHRLVRVVASGPRLTYLAVCDLTTSTCVNAARARRAWVARLPAQDPDGPYAIGVVGRGPGGYVTGHFASDPPPDVPPIVNIG